jgi:hypothetical protein
MQTAGPAPKGRCRHSFGVTAVYANTVGAEEKDIDSKK